MNFKEKYQDKLTFKENKTMLISKEDFIELFSQLQKREEKMNKVADGIEQLIDGYACININSDFDATVINLIMKLTGDTEDVIFWWLYEDVEKQITITTESLINKTEEDVIVEIDTLEDLYEYLNYCV